MLEFYSKDIPPSVAQQLELTRGSGRVNVRDYELKHLDFYTSSSSSFSQDHEEHLDPIRASSNVRNDFFINLPTAHLRGSEASSAHAHDATPQDQNETGSSKTS
jgi:hypothetical protein